MTADTSVASGLGIYVCPACKGHLCQEEGALRCPTCSQTYPIREGIPDFIREELSQIFTDTVIALREMARVMKPGAILAVFTFTAGRGGILKFRRAREWYRKDQGLHVFGLPEMEQYLTASGFKDFQPEVSGSILTFSALKQ